MAEYAVGEISRAGEKVKLRVDDNGNWLTTAAGRNLKALTRDRLIAEVDRALRLEKKAVHIPFTLVENKNNGYVTLKHGVVTGVHSGTGNLLVAWDDGSNGQLSSGGAYVDLMKRLTPSEEAELGRLAKEANRAADALRGFRERKRVSNGAKGLAGQVAELLAKDGG